MRVLLCRARDDGAATAGALRDAGHEAVVAPVLHYVWMDATLPGGGFDALLLTSARAAEGLTLEQVARLAALPVYAVGRRSAAAARRRGFRDIRTGAGDAAALLPLVTLTLARPGRLLYLAGRTRKPDLEEGLRRGGYAVEAMEVYDAAPALPWPEAVLDELRGSKLDACLHYSRRSAALAIAAARLGGVGPQFIALRHFCISPDAAAPLLEVSALDLRVAECATEAGLFACIFADR